MRSTAALSLAAAAALLTTAEPSAAAAARSEARVTQLVRDVKVLPERAEPRAVSLNERVGEGEAVRTGTASRSELTFADLTIIRLGANTIFSFARAGRDVRLTSGSLLLQAPGASGGRNIRTDPVTVAITGTTVIVEQVSGGPSRLIVLEGGARLSLNRARAEFRDLRGGQMLEVPRGARTLGRPMEVSLDDVLQRHPLARDFPGLRNREGVARAQREQANRQQQGRTTGAPGRPGGPGSPGNPGAPPGPATSAPGAGSGAGQGRGP